MDADEGDFTLAPREFGDEERGHDVGIEDELFLENWEFRQQEHSEIILADLGGGVGVTTLKGCQFITPS